MSNIKTHIASAMSLFKQGNFAQIISQFSNSYSQDPMLSMVYAVALGKEKQYELSFSILDDLHRRFPKNVDVLHNHGLLLHASGDSRSAIVKHKIALKLKADYHPAQIALGELFLQLEHTKEAIAAFSKAFSIQPDAQSFQGLLKSYLVEEAYTKCSELVLSYPDFLSHQTIAEYFVEANYLSHNRALIRRYFSALTLQYPNSYLILLYSALSEIEGKRYIFAQNALKHALTICNKAYGQYQIESNLRYVSWLIDPSEQNFKRFSDFLIADNSDQSKIFLHNVYEVLGRIDEAQEQFEATSDTFKQSTQGKLAFANILFRQSKLEQADNVLEELITQHSDLLSAYYLRIKVLEKQSKFEQSADLIKLISNIDKSKSRYFSNQSHLRLSEFDAKPVRARHVSDSTAKIIFIVGFPRSGTTLLEKELLSASDLALMEETDACSSFFEQTAERLNISDWEAFLDTVGKVELDALAKEYLSFLSSFVQFDASSQVLLDKMPLNFPYLPLMLAMFPRSQVICCVRDPRDIALSCLKYEELNIYTPSSFYEAYNTVFSYSLSLEALFEEMWLEIKYEHLVGDVDATMTRLCTNLGLFDNKLKQDTVLLQTPSYYQVSQPIYKSSVGLYASYSAFINFRDPLLDKWLEHWGYE